VLSVRVSTQLPGARQSATDLESIKQLVADGTAERGFRPLSDQGWVDLVHGAAMSAVAVQVTDGPMGRLVGYAQAVSAPGGDPAWTVEVVIAGDSPDRVSEDRVSEDRVREVGGRLLDATVSAVRDAGGTELIWLVQGPTKAHDDLAAAHGLELGRRLLQMRRPLPTGIEFDVATRPFDADHDVAEWVRVNARAFAWNPEQGSWTEENVRARMEEPWFDPDGFLIHDRAAPDGTVRMAGFCWTKVHDATPSSPALGEIYVIAVDPDFHGLGLGRALTLAGLDSLSGRGITIGMLFVDADNAAAVTLYDKLGFNVHRTDCLYAGSIDGA
jgi:mycothiol synthase